MVAMINQQLKQLVESFDIFSSNLVMTKSFSVEIVTPRSFYDQRSMAKKLKKARLVYIKIFDNTNISNNTNGAPILVYMGMAIILLITSSYKVVLVIKGTVPFTPNSFYNVSVRLAWIIIMIVYCRKTHTLVRFKVFF